MNMRSPTCDHRHISGMNTTAGKLATSCSVHILALLFSSTLLLMRSTSRRCGSLTLTLAVKELDNPSKRTPSPHPLFCSFSITPHAGCGTKSDTPSLAQWRPGLFCIRDVCKICFHWNDGHMWNFSLHCHTWIKGVMHASSLEEVGAETPPFTVVMRWNSPPVSER